jgi:hypothetical protein
LAFFSPSGKSLELNLEKIAEKVKRKGLEKPQDKKDSMTID